MVRLHRVDLSYKPEHIDAVIDENDRLVKRVAELEAAATSVLAQLNPIMHVRLPGHVAGALVHARETLKSVVK